MNVKLILIGVACQFAMQGSSNAMVISSSLMHIVAKCRCKIHTFGLEEYPDVFLILASVVKDFHKENVPASGDDKDIA